MNKLLLVIIVSALVWYKFGGTSNLKALDANGNPIVLAFSVDNCQGHCEDVTRELERRGAPFEEIKVNPSNKGDENTILWKKMGGKGFPHLASGEDRVLGFSKPKIASLLGANFGDQYLTKIEKKYYSKHFNYDGSPKIVMYGADWCGYCAKLRKEFKNANIDYIEIDVEKQENHKNLSQVMGISGYPTTFVGYSRVNGATLKAVRKEL